MNINIISIYNAAPPVVVISKCIYHPAASQHHCIIFYDKLFISKPCKIRNTVSIVVKRFHALTVCGGVRLCLTITIGCIVAANVLISCKLILVLPSPGSAYHVCRWYRNIHLVRSVFAVELTHFQVRHFVRPYRALGCSVLGSIKMPFLRNG